MGAVLADHTDDVVTFELAPPSEVRGKDAYRDTWRPFFKYQRRGTLFEIVSFDVTAGADVGF
jgi:ketosteroid isomerase-like protein